MLLALPDTPEAAELWARYAADDDAPYEEREPLIEQVLSYPNIEVAPVSFLRDNGVPATVNEVMGLLGPTGAVLTPGTIKAVTVAFNLPNRSIYGHRQYSRVKPESIDWYRAETRTRKGRRTYGTFHEPGYISYKGPRVASGRRVKRFLEANRGARLVYDIV